MCVFSCWAVESGLQCFAASEQIKKESKIINERNEKSNQICHYNEIIFLKVSQAGDS